MVKHDATSAESTRQHAAPGTYLLLAVGDVAYVAPGEGLVGAQLAVGAVDVKPLGIHAQQQVGVSLVLLPFRQNRNQVTDQHCVR